jgi:hypothetical protein
MCKLLLYVITSKTFGFWFSDPDFCLLLFVVVRHLKTQNPARGLVGAAA